MKQQKIIHVDMDAFYVSVEIRDNPNLRDKPVAVGGQSNARGVLSTCNYIAREYGVRSAMPTNVAMRKCPDLILVPARMEVYKEVSTKIREIFERYTGVIEPLSLDEAYLDVTNCEVHNGSATLIAKDICKSIESELNLTASAGVAPIKFLAKIASDINKPNGIFVITPEEVEAFIADMPLKHIPGVGKVTFEKLKAQNLIYGRDISGADEQLLITQFGKLGKLLWQRCNGIDEREVVSSRIRKSVGVESTFPTDIDDFERLKEILLNELLPELRRRSSKYIASRNIQKIGVKVKFYDFHQTTKEFTYSDIDEDLFSQILKEAVERGKGKKVRLLGAHVSLRVEKEKSQQLSFSW